MKKKIVIIVIVVLISGFLYNVTNTQNPKEQVNEKYTGDGVWVYLPDDSYLNETVNFIKKNSLKNIYISSGGVEVRNDNVNGKYEIAYFYDSVNLKKINSYFNSSYKIHAMFESDRESSKVINTLSQQELEQLSVEIANLVNNKTYIDGLHFDLEPFNKGIGDLIIKTKTKTENPLSVALGNFKEDDFFKYIDYPILMNFDQCVDDIDDFKRVTKRRAKEFYNICKKYNNSNCQYGIAGVKTYCEKDNIAQHFNISYEIYDNYSSKNSKLVYYGLFVENDLKPIIK